MQGDAALDSTEHQKRPKKFALKGQPARSRGCSAGTQGRGTPALGDTLLPPPSGPSGVECCFSVWWVPLESLQRGWKEKHHVLGACDHHTWANPHFRNPWSVQLQLFVLSVRPVRASRSIYIQAMILSIVELKSLKWIFWLVNKLSVWVLMNADLARKQVKCSPSVCLFITPLISQRCASLAS